MKNTLKIGLIGLGKMGQNHLRVLSMLKAVDLQFIFDFDIDVMNKLSKEYDVKASRILEDDLQNVDAVVIVTPTFTHYEYILNVSKYVKNIFVEKPLTDKLSTTSEIMKLAHDQSLNIQIGFIERFNPAIIELKKVLEHSNNIINIDFERTNKVSSRITDVDVITDLMIHDIDLALFLNGDFKSVQSYGVIENNMIAFARATIKHKNGVYSNITASRITEKRIRQVSATCEDMYVDCNLLKKEILVNKQTVKQNYENISLMSIEESINVSPQEALLNEHIGFLKFCLENNQNVPKVQDAYAAMKIASIIQDQIWSTQ
ncbi:MAG: Gfo/Idh/MocA family oxidoreductase [Campylobacteraceae bacterium]|nr:Gfo/Idh/MocA family oxidoreductase [Campylobacteraceae bacterium]